MSTPIIYYNLDLVTKAGGDPAALPATWYGIFQLARKVKALGGATQGFGWAELSEPGVDETVRAAAARLAELGIEVVEVDLPWHRHALVSEGTQ